MKKAKRRCGIRYHGEKRNTCQREPGHRGAHRVQVHHNGRRVVYGWN